MRDSLKSGAGFGSILPKNWLSFGWEEISRRNNENQLLITIGHINPEDKANPVLTSGNPSQVVNGEAVAVHGISTRGSMTKFYEAMKKMAATGWMPGYTPEKIENMRNQNNKLLNEKYDMQSDVSIIKCMDEKAAETMLKNQISLPTEGFAGFKIPGMDGKMANFLDNEAILKSLTPEQQAGLKKAKEMMSSMKGKIQETHQKEGLKYFLGEYFGHQAAFSEIENPDYKRFMAPKPKAKEMHTFHGGGFDPLAGKGILPKRPKAGPPPKTIKSCLGLVVGKYFISGSLISSAVMLPSENTFCESLTQQKTHIETEKVEGETYTTKHLVPVASTYAREGYANKEQAEQMIKKIIDQIKTN